MFFRMQMKLLVALLLIASQHNSPQDQQPQPKNHAAVAQNQPQSAPQPPHAVSAESIHAQTNKDDRGEDESQSYGLWMLGFNAILAAATVAYVVVSVRMLRALKKQGDVLISGERAWILTFLEPGYSVTHGSGTDGDKVSVWVRIICRNSGKSPAWITGKAVHVALVREIPTMPPIDFSALTYPVAQNDPDPYITDPEWVECPGKFARDDGQKLLLYGAIRYRDIFGKDRQTTFGYEYGHVRRLFERITAHPEYNRAT